MLWSLPVATKAMLILAALQADVTVTPSLFPGAQSRLIQVLSFQAHSSEWRAQLETQLRWLNDIGHGQELEYAYFQHVLGVMRTFNASEPRDKIYTALDLVKSLYPQVGKDMPQPDYDLPVRKVYYETTSILLERLRFRTILSYVTQGTEHKTLTYRHGFLISIGALPPHCSVRRHFGDECTAR